MQVVVFCNNLINFVEQRLKFSDFEGSVIPEQSFKHKSNEFNNAQICFGAGTSPQNSRFRKVFSTVYNSSISFTHPDLEKNELTKSVTGS